MRCRQYAWGLERICITEHDSTGVAQCVSTPGRRQRTCYRWIALDSLLQKPVWFFCRETKSGDARKSTLLGKRKLISCDLMHIRWPPMECGTQYSPPWEWGLCYITFIIYLFIFGPFEISLSLSVGERHVNAPHFSYLLQHRETTPSYIQLGIQWNKVCKAINWGWSVLIFYLLV